MQRIMPELVGIALQSYFYFQILDISVKVFLSVFPFILLFMSVLFCHYCGRVTFHVFFISLKIGLKAEKWWDNTQDLLVPTQVLQCCRYNI